MGGGLLETNNQLERFTKNKKSKKLTYSIIGILLIIGSITLFKTYAFFEEKQEFNVIKGQVPSHWYDMNLISVKVEGKETESIPERGLYKTNVNCTNGYGEWDYNSWSLKLTDLKENTKCNIEFTKNLSTEEYNKYLEAGKALRRNTYRGKDITSYYTDGSLYEMISSGTFDDIYVGDYIRVSGIRWTIADIDNYLSSGTNYLAKHHVTIVPLECLKIDSMNETDSTVGGYANSRMVKEVLPALLEEKILPVFGEHVLTYSTVLSNRVDVEASNFSGGQKKGASNGSAWHNRQLDLMNEINVYGTSILASSYHDNTLDNHQYALFKLRPNLIADTWLRNVANASDFIFINSNRNIESSKASNLIGVRPRFLIG